MPPHLFGYPGERQDYRSEAREPLYSSDEDETYGSEWRRDQSAPFDRGELVDRASEQARSQGRANPGRGQVGHYGAGGRGGYSGGYSGGGFGGSSGTSYERGNVGRGEPGSNYRGGASSSQSPYRGPSYGGGSSGGGSYGGASYGRSDRGFEQHQVYGGQQRGAGVGFDPGSGASGGALSERRGFAGRGPKGYTRTDDRIREDVCERLSLDDDIDASEIEVSVKEGEVTLRGSVITRSMKHQAEDLAEDVSGVRDVHNELRVMKGLLAELKDKVTGDDHDQHFANGGTKNAPASGATRATTSD